MARADRHGSEGRLPKGVQALDRPRQGRRYRARIRHGKRGEIHLGLYETPWLAAFAYNVAAQAIGRAGEPPNPIPHAEQPKVERVHAITSLVRRRLGLDPSPRRREERTPSADELVTLFEVAVIGFWRAQATAAEAGGLDPLDAAAARLLASARLLFWSRSAGHPEPGEAMIEALVHRLGAAFGLPELTRELLDDDGDEPLRIARWLVHPDSPPGGRGRGFVGEVRYLYAEHFRGSAGNPDGPADWAAFLGIVPPFSLEQVRLAYRERSRDLHPDAGGTEAEFLRLQAAYEAARRYCEAHGV